MILADRGSQYRSAIFFHSKEQESTARSYLKQLGQAKIWPDPIVTEIEALTKFYRAEDSHQNYFNDNPSAGYCNFVIRPKVAKFKKSFSNKLKQGF